MKLAWGARVSPLFREKVVRRSPEIGADPSALMAVMAFETGRTFSPSVKNPGSSGSGLLQFMRDTAPELGTTVEALRAMTAEEQLDYVFRYLANRVRESGRKLSSITDLYMAVLWPKAIGKPDDYVLFDSTTSAKQYFANRGVDLDRDGDVTKGEAASFVVKLLAEGMRAENVFDYVEAEEVDVPVLTDEVQVDAQIEEQSRPAREEDVARINETETKPMAPILGGLAAIIFQALAPMLQNKLTEKFSKWTGDQGAAGQASGALTGALGNFLTESAKAVTGKPTEVQAAAALEAEGGDGPLAQAVVADVEARLAAVAPFVDKIAELERESFVMEEDSRDRAAARARTDTVDHGSMIVFYVLGGFAIVVLGLLGALIVQMRGAPGEPPDPTLISLLAGAVGVIISKMNTIVDYRFGSSRGSAAKDVIVEELARTNQQPIVAASPRSRVTATVTTKS